MFLIPEDQYRHKLDVLAAHCRDVGRDPAQIRLQLVLQVVLGADAREARDQLARARRRCASRWTSTATARRP